MNDETEYRKFRLENETKLIHIHDFSWWREGDPLEDIKINISKLRNQKKSTMQKNIFDYFTEIKCIGYKSLKKYITKEIFDNIFDDIYKLDFEKLYNENSSGCDGSEFILEISRAFEFSNNIKKIELWSPYPDENNIETNKLLEIYERIKVIVEYDNYCNNIDQYLIKRKKIKQFENSSEATLPSLFNVNKE